jgi:hypothetical protein
MMTLAQARPGVISAETYACTSWAAAHEYTLQSLRPTGGQMNKNCPIRIEGRIGRRHQRRRRRLYRGDLSRQDLVGR